MADGLVDSGEFETAVDDILWVLLHDVGGISCIPAKQAHDTEGNALMKPGSKPYSSK